MYLKNSGLADTAYFGAEAEFFIFRQHSASIKPPTPAITSLTPRRAVGNSGRVEQQPGLPSALQGRLLPGFLPPITIRTFGAPRWWRP